MDTTVVEVPVKRAMIAASDKVVLVADAAKFPGTGMARVCGPEDLDVVVTNAPAGPGDAAWRSSEAGVQGDRGSGRREADDSGRRRLPGPAGLPGAARRPRRGPRHPRDPARPGRRRGWPPSAGCSPSRPRGSPDAPEVTATTDLDEALPGADFVFSAIRVGGLAGPRGRRAGGAATRACSARRRSARAASRTACARVPVADATSPGASRRLAPDAWVINFTNPAGLVTEAMSRHLGDRVIGICDSPVGPRPPGRRARWASTPRAPGSTTSGSTTSAGCAGCARRRPRRAAAAARRRRRAGLLRGGQAVRRRLAAHARRGPQRVPALLLLQPGGRRAPPARPSRPAARSCCDQQERLLRRGEAAGRRRRAGGLGRHPAEREATYMAENREAAGAGERDADDLESGGYEQVALALMRAIARDERTTLILNVRNRGTLAVLDADAVIEVPCLVDANGARPIAVDPLPDHAIGLVTAVKAVERAVLDAAAHRLARRPRCGPSRCTRWSTPSRCARRLPTEHLPGATSSRAYPGQRLPTWTARDVPGDRSMHDDRRQVEERLDRVAATSAIRPRSTPRRCRSSWRSGRSPGEPVPVAEALAAPYEPFALGEPWGRPWSTSWFRAIRRRYPPEWAGRRVEAVFDLGFVGDWPGNQAEALVHDAAGAPAQGRRTRRTSTCPSPARPRRRGGAAAGRGGGQPRHPGRRLPCPTPLGDRLTAGDEPLYTVRPAPTWPCSTRRSGTSASTSRCCAS